MDFSFEHIITLIAVAGGVFAIYHSIQKIRDQIIGDAVWKTDMQNTLKNLTEKVDDLLIEHKENARTTRELREAKISIDLALEKLANDRHSDKKSFDDLRKRVVELELESAKLKGERQ